MSINQNHNCCAYFIVGTISYNNYYAVKILVIGIQIIHMYLIDWIFETKYYLSITTQFCHNQPRLITQYQIWNSRYFFCLSYIKSIVKIMRIFLLAERFQKWKVKNLIGSIVIKLISSDLVMHYKHQIQGRNKICNIK